MASTRFRTSAVFASSPHAASYSARSFSKVAVVLPCCSNQLLLGRLLCRLNIALYLLGESARQSSNDFCMKSGGFGSSGSVTSAIRIPVFALSSICCALSRRSSRNASEERVSRSSFKRVARRNRNRCLLKCQANQTICIFVADCLQELSADRQSQSEQLMTSDQSRHHLS